MDRSAPLLGRFLACVFVAALGTGVASAQSAGDAERVPFAYPELKSALSEVAAVGAVAVEVDQRVFEQALPEGSIEVALPGGDSVRLVELQREEAAGGDWTLVGRVADDPLGRSVVLTFGGDAVFGVIPGNEGQLWHLTSGPDGETIAPAGGLRPLGVELPKCFGPLCGKSSATETDASPEGIASDTFADDVRVPAATKAMRKVTRISDYTAATGTDTTIDLLGLYSRDLATLRGGDAAAETEFRNLVALANQAHADSGSAVRFNLVGLRAIEIPSTSSNNSVLSNVTNEADFGGVAIRDLRDELAADLVAVLRPYNGGFNCGVAWGVGFNLTPGMDWQNVGFSVSNVAPCGPYTLAHELGHNLGSHHDVETTTRGTGDIERGAYVFSHGYRQDAAPAFATVMAYQRGSQAQLGRFSHPGGTACSGVACGIDGEADNVRSMRLMAPRVARFRDPAGSVSALDSSLAEGDSGESYAVVEVRFSGRAPAGGIEFTFETGGGTATPGVDFTPIAPTLIRIPEGQSVAYVPVAILGDTAVEPVETFSARVTSTASGVRLFDGIAEVAILDDDPKRRVSGRVTFGSVAPPTQPVELRFATASDVPVPRDVTALPPDFRYSLEVRAGTRLRLESTSAAVPFASTAADFGVIDTDTTRDIALRSGVIVSGRYIFPEGAAAPTGSLQVTAQIQPGGDGSRSYSRQLQVSPPDFGFSVDMPHDSTVDFLLVNPPLPWLNWQTRQLRSITADRQFEITAESGVVLSGDISVAAGMDWPARTPGLRLFYDDSNDISPFVTVTGRSYAIAVRRNAPFSLSAFSSAFGVAERRSPGINVDARLDIVLPRMPRLEPVEIRVSEGAVETSVVALPLSGARPEGPKNAIFTAEDETTTREADYSLGSNAVAIQSGATHATFPMYVRQDWIVEGDESFLIRVPAGPNLDGPDIQYRVVIVDDDGAPPAQPVLRAWPATQTEGTATQPTVASVRFTLDRPAPNGGVLFRVATVEPYPSQEFATPGRDFVAIDRDVLIPAGQSSIDVPIDVIADDEAERNEKITVGFVPAPGVVRGSFAVEVTIRDDDVNRTLGARPDRFRVMDGAGSTALDALVNDWMDVARMTGGSLSIVNAPNRGVASVDTRSTPSPTDDRIVYSPSSLRTGKDSLRYRLCEGGGARCVEAAVDLWVQPLFLGGTSVQTPASAGRADRQLQSVRAIDSLRVVTRGQTVSTASVPLLVPGDGGSYSPWDEGGQGTFTAFQRIQASSTSREMQIVAWLEESAGRELDAYVGVDLNRNNRAEENELRCAAAAVGVGDDCDFAVTVAARATLDYWVLVHNPVGNSTAYARIHAAAVDIGSDSVGMHASAPGKVGAMAASQVRLGWNLPLMAERDVGVSMLKLSVDSGGEAASQPFRVVRNASAPTPRALVASKPMDLALAGGVRESMLFIDVPEGQEALEVRTTSDQNVDLALARRDLPRPTSTTPLIGIAPTDAEILARSETNGGAERLRIDRPAAGRWHVIVTNRGTSRATATVDVQMSGAVPALRPGGYFNPRRSGSGLFLYPAEGDWAGLWYTYLQDGTPTWYYLQGAAPGANGIWRGTIYRSAWNGSSNHLSAVGEATVTPTGPDAFTYTYTLDGETGSEAYASLGRGCPNPGGSALNVSGHWFNPARSGTGYSVQMFPNYEFYAVFGYDAQGVPRFLVAERESMGGPSETLDLEQINGTCPLCARSGDPIRRTIGTFQRTFANGAFGNITLNGTFTAGVPGTWAANDAVIPLGGLQGCATP